jgi:hypothetical protein
MAAARALTTPLIPKGAVASVLIPKGSLLETPIEKQDERSHGVYVPNKDTTLRSALATAGVCVLAAAGCKF